MLVAIWHMLFHSPYRYRFRSCSDSIIDIMIKLWQWFFYVAIYGSMEITNEARQNCMQFSSTSELSSAHILYQFPRIDRTNMKSNYCGKTIVVFARFRFVDGFFNELPLNTINHFCTMRAIHSISICANVLVN